MRDFSTKEVFHRKPAEDFSRKRIQAIYCPGDSAGVSSAPAGDSVVAAGASVAAGFISVAAGAVVGAGVAAGVTVSVFLFTSREKGGTGQNADVFLHS